MKTAASYRQHPPRLVWPSDFSLRKQALRGPEGDAFCVVPSLSCCRRECQGGDDRAEHIEGCRNREALKDPLEFLHCGLSTKFCERLVGLPDTARSLIDRILGSGSRSIASKSPSWICCAVMFREARSRTAPASLPSVPFNSCVILSLFKQTL